METVAKPISRQEASAKVQNEELFFLSMNIHKKSLESRNTWLPRRNSKLKSTPGDSLPSRNQA